MSKALKVCQRPDGFWNGLGNTDGILDKQEYLPIVVKAWSAIVKEVPDYEDYGVGCFSLTGTEVYKLDE